MGLRNMSWRGKGKCARLPLALSDLLFFPPDGERPGKDKWKRETQAKEFCVGCPVTSQCLAFALDTGQIGVWGETGDDDRKKMQRVGHRASCPRCKGKNVFTDDAKTVEICVGCGVTWRVKALV